MLLPRRTIISTPSITCGRCLPTLKRRSTHPRRSLWRPTGRASVSLVAQTLQDAERSDLLARSLDRLQMLLEHQRHLGRWNAAKAAIGRKPELRQEFPRQRDALLEAIHMMDDAEIDPRAARLEVFQRREERLADVRQHRNVNPVDAPARRLDDGVGKIDGRRQI